MTHDEAVNLKTFKHYCTCGGFAWNLNGRPKEQPHLAWCPQLEEYADWYQALRGKDTPVQPPNY